MLMEIPDEDVEAVKELLATRRAEREAAAKPKKERRVKRDVSKPEPGPIPAPPRRERRVGPKVADRTESE